MSLLLLSLLLHVVAAVLWPLLPPPLWLWLLLLLLPLLLLLLLLVFLLLREQLLLVVHVADDVVHVADDVVPPWMQPLPVSLLLQLQTLPELQVEGVQVAQVLPKAPLSWNALEEAAVAPGDLPVPVHLVPWGHLLRCWAPRPRP